MRKTNIPNGAHVRVTGAHLDWLVGKTGYITQVKVTQQTKNDSKPYFCYEIEFDDVVNEDIPAMLTSLLNPWARAFDQPLCCVLHEGLIEEITSIPHEVLKEHIRARL